MHKRRIQERISRIRARGAHPVVPVVRNGGAERVLVDLRAWQREDLREVLAAIAVREHELDLDAIEAE